MKIEYRNGLLFVTVEIVYNGQKKEINNRGMLDRVKN